MGESIISVWPLDLAFQEYFCCPDDRAIRTKQISAIGNVLRPAHVSVTFAVAAFTWPVAHYNCRHPHIVPLASLVAHMKDGLEPLGRREVLHKIFAIDLKLLKITHRNI